jgi:hypothetical protein
MKIKIESRDASEDDCHRNDYFCTVDGVEHMLAGIALGSYWTREEIKANAKIAFGEDVEIDWSENDLPTS